MAILWLAIGTAHAGGIESATEALCGHITSAGRQVLVAKDGDQTVWSDAAIFERAAKFPPRLSALLEHPTGTIPAATVTYFHGVDARSAEWHSAQLRHSGTGDFSCELTDGKVTAPVDCRYLAYLTARYPKADVRVKSPVEPLLFLDGGRLVALLMPVKR